jgi:glutamine synthetase
VHPVGVHQLSRRSLDHKTPLLRSLEALIPQCTAFLKLLGDVDVQCGRATLGCEQEYFSGRPRPTRAARPGAAERTLLGAASARGQQFEDHYFGSIPARVLAFMEEMEFELYRLGSAGAHRHNEVAPMQFEMAPVFEDVNLANDHNVLAMDMARKVALRTYSCACCTRSRSSGINGSGKHCNWSHGHRPRREPARAGQDAAPEPALPRVHRRVPEGGARPRGSLRWSIVGANNDLRLGANEAPPAIISVFVGDLLTRSSSGSSRREGATDPSTSCSRWASASCRSSPRTTPTATAPRRSRSRATSSSSARWAAHRTAPCP